ncbi:hypothetical protein GPECTOR_1g152 [Gonium pectorale]|uniref:Kinesin motor domain-containing protein n=1 Tax=Gonium pectorale TaxID=33097 RepID=A0A150H1Z9_GONPE|nr:hypothetical protein GPECTOR_1g152 [Gonium pectorale]|eukprot:KXZ56177.1 hypothetical protein GPECTOR_1g152 [Gonium pectorale]
MGDREEQPNRVQVVVRVRPVLPHELSDEVAVSCSPDARRVQVALPERLAANAGPGRGAARSYDFDACLAGSTTQEELFEVCGMQELVEAALDGYCVTIFAFGQTGSGKTHTIIGPRLSRGRGGAAAAGGGGAGGGGDDPSPSPARASGGENLAGGTKPPPGTAGGGGGGSVLIDPEDGVLTRCLAAAYRSMAARSASGGVEWSVSASVVELYNEAVTDLLGADRSKQLQVRKDARDGFAVSGLTQASCPTDSSALRVCVRALQHRHTRSHKLNEYSSRSHCLMTFVFGSREAAAQDGEQGGEAQGGQQGAKGGVRRYGKLCLVDLAGSERLKDTGNTERGAIRETGAINKSLFTLGQVLAALSARSSAPSSSAAAAPFVPYRDSKLTQLLWDGLRGSGRCLMLACLGPMRGAAEESLNTLHFASLASRIKAEPVVLLDPQDQLVVDLRKVISQLRQENAQLATALQQLSLGADPAAVMAALPEALRASAAAAAAAAGMTGVVTPPRTAAPPAAPPASPQRAPSSAPSSARETASPARALPLPPPGRAKTLQPLSAKSGKSLLPKPPGLDNGPSTSASPSQPDGRGRVLRVSVSHGSPLTSGHAGLEPGPAPRSAPTHVSAGDLPSPGSAPSDDLPTPPGGATGGGHSRIKQAWAPSSGNSRKQLQPLGASPYGRAASSPTRAQLAASSEGLPSSAGGGGGAGGGAGRASASPKRRGANRARSVGRNGGAAAVAAAGGAGGGGGAGGASSRPAYLTADPAALLYGYTSALPPLPPGSSDAVGASTSPLATPPALRSAAVDRSLAPPPPPALAEFPDLAAMEAEFQQLMAAGGGMANAGPNSLLAGPPAKERTSPARRPGGAAAGGSGGGASAAAEGGDGGGSGDEEESGEPRPDVRALKWAERNGWFGTDFEMTSYAYEVHDQLVEREGVDPTSDLYYMEIERRVAEAFPAKWAVVMHHALPGGSGASAVARIRRAAPSPGPLLPADFMQRERERYIQEAQEEREREDRLASARGHFGAGLRVSVKDPLRSGAGGGGSGSGSAARDAAAAASLAEQAASARSRHHNPSVPSERLAFFSPAAAAGAFDGPYLSPYDATYGGAASAGPAASSQFFAHSHSHASYNSYQSQASSQPSSHTGAHSASASGYATPDTSSATAPSTPGGGGGGAVDIGGPVTPGAQQPINPFNIGALHAVAPPRGSRFAPVPGRRRGGAPAPGGGGGGAGAAEAADPRAAERLQREYARQRAAVVEELRVAKEEAEVERQRILARIHRAAGGSKWRR